MLESFNTNTQTILLLGIVVFVVVSLLGLILWNVKTNKQVKALTSIDDSLKHLDFQEAAAPKDQEITTQEADAPEESESPPEEASEAPPEPETPAPPDETAIAKSGRIYTRQELEALIRD